MSSSEEEQKRRIVARDGLSMNEAQARMACQMPGREKVRRATYVIDNNGRLSSIYFSQKFFASKFSASAVNVVRPPQILESDLFKIFQKKRNLLYSLFLLEAFDNFLQQTQINLNILRHTGEYNPSGRRGYSITSLKLAALYCEDEYYPCDCGNCDLH